MDVMAEETIAEEVEVIEEQEISEPNTVDETADDSGDEEVVVSIGEETPPTEEARAPEWVRELRKSHRDLQRQNRELQSKLQSQHTEAMPVTLGSKPKLEDHDYDTDRYEASLAEWYERKSHVDQRAEQAKMAEMAERTAWQAELDRYGKARDALKVKDYEDAEAIAQEVFSSSQQGYIVHCAKNPAQVVYALGKNPKKAKELAGIRDPLAFAYALSDLEKEIKVTNRKAAPPPEKTVSGTGRVSGAVDSTLERLRDEAARTGNMTKVIQYKAQKRAASK